MAKKLQLDFWNQVWEQANWLVSTVKTLVAVISFNLDLQIYFLYIAAGQAVSDLKKDDVRSPPIYYTGPIRFSKCVSPAAGSN